MAHPLEIVAPTVLNACTSLTGWAAIAGSIALAAPPSTRYGTTPFIKLTSAVNTASIMDLTLNQTIPGRLGVFLYLADYDVGYGSGQNTATCTVYASNDSGYTNYYFRATILKAGWNFVNFSAAVNSPQTLEDPMWSTSGSPSWGSAMTRIRIRVEARAGTTTNLYVCGINYGGYYKPQVIIDFDDQHYTAYTVAFPIMQAFGIKGTMNVIGNKIDQANYCTTAQLQEMYDAGWDMCNHTLSHVQGSYYGGTRAYCDSEIQGGESILIAKGWTRSNCHKHFAAPYGESTYREATPYRDSIAANCLTGRTTVERAGVMSSIDDRVNIYSVIPLGTTEAVAIQTARIDGVVGSGGVLRFLFHQILTPADLDLKYAVADFTTIMQKLYLLKQSNTIDCPTWTEYYDKVAGWDLLNRNTWDSTNRLVV